MKILMILVITVLSLTSYGQSKYNYTQFNKLTEVVGTDYVIATFENWGKMERVKNNYLLFIDTKTGQTNQVDFIKGSDFEKIEQVKIDELEINKIIVCARTVGVDEKRIGWNSPKQIIILSTNGKERNQLTDSKLFVRTWAINKKTGTVVVTGHYDTNNNGKEDNSDKNEIGIYDLKTLKLISKID